MSRVGAGVAEIASESPQEASANIASLSDVIQKNPTAEAYNTRGVAYARIGQLPGSDRRLHPAAIKLDPNNAASLTNRALAYRQMNQQRRRAGRFQSAPSPSIRTMRRPISAAPICCAQQGKLDEARSDLDQAIRLNPENAQAFHARGLIDQREGNHPQAITDFGNAIDRDPFVGAPYQARGQSLIAVGQPAKAIEDFNAALNVNNRNPRRLGRPRPRL